MTAAISGYTAEEDKLISILRYRDLLKAIEWLTTTLGFEHHFVAESGGQIVHAQLRMGEALLMLGRDPSDDRYGMHSPLALNGPNQCVYVLADGNGNEAYAGVNAAGAEIVTAPYDIDYGSREFTCRDPEGYICSIGSYAGESIKA